MEVSAYSYFRWCGYFQGTWCHLLPEIRSLWVSQKLLQGLVSHKLTVYLSLSDLCLTQSIMTISSKGCKPDNLEPQSSLKLSFMNIWGLLSNFVDGKSFLEESSPDILSLCKTNLDDSIDFGNFSVKGYLYLIRKEVLPFPRDLSLENSADSYLSFRPAISITFFVVIHGFWFCSI